MEEALPVRKKVYFGGTAAWMIAGLSVAALVYGQSFLLPKIIIRYVESALELKIAGPVRPVWGRFEFSIDPVQTLWDGKIKINSGRIFAGYGLEKGWTGALHMVITGENVDAELLGDWVSLAGGHSAVFKDLYADLIIDHTGIKEIRALRAESPSLQFRFGEASNRHLKESHEA